MAYPGGVTDGLKRVEEPGDPSVGCLGIILSDVVPNSVEIIVGPATEHIRQRSGFPALLGFALEPSAGIRRQDVLAAIQGVEAAAQFFIESGELHGAGAVMFFQQAKRFADDLTRGVVTA